MKPFITELMNPTGLALDRDGNLFVSCRNDGTIHRVSPDGRSMQWIEGMGIATGIAFDQAGNLYVGDRSGTIFKISPDREIFVFATLEPSIAAYHLAFSPAGELYVTGPTTSSFDRVYRIISGGRSQLFFADWGGRRAWRSIAAGILYVAASLGGKRGIVRLTPQAQAELVLGGSNIVGLALLPTHRAMITTNNALYTLDWDIEGLPLPVVLCEPVSLRCSRFIGKTQDMKAEIIAVGSELLTPYRLDTNSLFLTSELNQLGIRVIHKAVVGDTPDEMRSSFRHALDRAELVVSSRRPGPDRR